MSIAIKKEKANNEDIVEIESIKPSYISKANENYREILSLASTSKNKKFQYLEYWKYKESKLLLRELKNERSFFNEYRRGTIIKVDFGVNIGCEFSQVHYAIVLNKKDNRKNKTLNVIPLTSKDKKSTYNIGNVIFDNFLKSSKIHIDNILEEISKLKINGTISVEDEIEIKKLFKNIEKLKKVVDFYSENPVCSFACYKNITTINKTRILPPINEFDFINKNICSDDVMKKLDQKIVEHYTNYEYKNDININ